MSMVAAAVITAGVASAGASIYAANQQADAAGKAAGIQSQAAQAGIDEQRRQFEATQALLSPYVQAGGKGLSGQQDLLGLNGPEAQSAAIQAIQSGPQFSSMLQQGENALLQNAAATGGVRGGNTQGALMNFRPMLLNQLLSEQYNRLGGLAGMGQASAAGVGAAGMQSADSVGRLLGQQGAAQAGGALAQGQYGANVANALSQGAGTVITAIPQLIKSFSAPGGGA